MNTIFFVLAIPNLLVKLLTFNLLYRRTKQIKIDSTLFRSPCCLFVYPFQSVNHMAAFYETWYERYVPEDTPTDITSVRKVKIYHV
jgi:hypothetical protein